MVTHSAKETRQQNEQWGWGLVAIGEEDDWGGERKYREGLYKIGGVRTSLATMAFGFVGIKSIAFFSLANILIMAMFNFQFWVRIKIGSCYT